MYISGTSFFYCHENLILLKSLRDQRREAANEKLHMLFASIFIKLFLYGMSKAIGKQERIGWEEHGDT
jgi:hypothetical protein